MRRYPQGEGGERSFGDIVLYFGGEGVCRHIMKVSLDVTEVRIVLLELMGNISWARISEPLVDLSF